MSLQGPGSPLWSAVDSTRSSAPEDCGENGQPSFLPSCLPGLEVSKLLPAVGTPQWSGAQEFAVGGWLAMCSPPPNQCWGSEMTLSLSNVCPACPGDGCSCKGGGGGVRRWGLSCVQWAGASWLRHPPAEMAAGALIGGPAWHALRVNSVTSPSSPTDAQHVLV